MRECDVLIIGGGPAGSSAAWKLKAAGVDVLVLDRDDFPRLKLCAGWITPEVVADLEIDTASYPYRFMTFDRLHLYFKGVHVPARCVQHSIRRFEFDAWLLERSGAERVRHAVRSIRRDVDAYVVDEQFRARYLIGAGGTRCPVYRELFRAENPRAKELQTVTLEHEFEWDWQDRDCHLWFFDHGLPGYAWYVPKAHGWINIGIGGMAERIKHSREDIRDHWNRFIASLDRKLMRGASYEPTGYSYYLRGNVDVVRIDNAFPARGAGRNCDARQGRSKRPRSTQRIARGRCEHEGNGIRAR
jgi:flavin-dependent dehydrogenase